MRRVVLCLALFLLASPASAIVIKGSAGGAAACTTQSTVLSFTTENGNTAGLNTVTSSSGTARTPEGLGQSFTPASTFVLYSITIKIGAAGNTPVNLQMRVDDDDNMSSEFLDEVTNSVDVSSTPVTSEFLFPNRPTLTSGTTYYFGIAQGDGYDWGVKLRWDSAAGYGNGQYYDPYGDSFLLTGAESDLSSTPADIYFVVKKCD